MKWLATHWTTLAMAVILSLVTVGLFSEPSEVETLILPAAFAPDVRASRVGSIKYFTLDNREITDSVAVTITANRKDVFNLTCRPLLDDSKFPTDETVRETTVEITPRDFGLSENLRSIQITPFRIKVTYAAMTVRQLPLQVTAQDVMETGSTRYEVVSIRAIPPVIRVRLPFDKAQMLTSLPIRPIPVGKIVGRSESLTYAGAINVDLPDYKDVRRLEDFSVRVELRVIDDEQDVDGIPLFLSAPPIPDHKVELVDQMKFTVRLTGTADMIRALKERPELISVGVSLWSVMRSPYLLVR